VDARHRQRGLPLQSRRRVLLAATAMLLAVVVTTLPAAANADSTTPTFTLTPAAGPPGTHVAITGHLSATQIPVWAPMLKSPEFFTLLTDVCGPNATTGCTRGPTSLARCELLDGAINSVIHLDESTGAVTGSFVVGGSGTCVQSDPDAATHAAPPGRYELSVGCCVASEVGEFTLTAPSSEPTLPATGFPAALASLGGVILVAGGVLLRSYARWRRRAWPIGPPTTPSALFCR
jgi:hypothetical protein